MPTAHLHHHHHLLSLKGFQLPELQTTTNFFLIIPVQPPTWLNLGKVERKQIKDKFTSNYDEALPDAHYRTIYFYSQRTARQALPAPMQKMIIPGSVQLPAAKVSSVLHVAREGGSHTGTA